MTDLTEHKPSHSPWFLGFPFLSAPRTTNTNTRAATRGSSWLVALRCRLLRNAIDRELAAGADPDSRECRHLRASQLTAESHRQALAADYERLLTAATTFPQLDVVPVNWCGVRAARPRLDHLVQRLREDPQVSAQGVARARLLLTDGDSALHERNADERLVDEISSALALL